MATKLIENRKRGPNQSDMDKLTSQQRAFLHQLLAEDTFDIVAAARKAGYKKPGSAGYRLLRTPTIARALGKAQREREERCKLKGDDVLEYLRHALFFNPLQYFHPDKQGNWVVSDLSVIPEHIGRLIDRMEIEVTEYDDGSKTTHFKVELVSKQAALGYALKHLGLLNDKSVVQHQLGIDWDSLYAKQGEAVPDLIEQMLTKEETKALTAPYPTNEEVDKLNEEE